MSGPGSSSWMISCESKDEKYWQICCMLLWCMLIFYVRQCRHNIQHPVHTWNVTRKFSSLIESDTMGYGIIVIVGVKYEHDHLSRVKSRMLMALGPKDQSCWRHSPWQGNLYWPRRIMRSILPCQSLLQLQYFFFSGGSSCNTNTHECDWLAMVLDWFW